LPQTTRRGGKAAGPFSNGRDSRLTMRGFLDCGLFHCPKGLSVFFYRIITKDKEASVGEGKWFLNSSFDENYRALSEHISVLSK